VTCGDGGGGLSTASRNRRKESRGAAVEFGSGVGEMTKAQEEWSAGVFVVLMRVGVKALASCSEISTATARWQPGGASGGHGARGGGQQGRGTGPG
jgi:hypothetical protein